MEHNYLEQAMEILSKGTGTCPQDSLGGCDCVNCILTYMKGIIFGCNPDSLLEVAKEYTEKKLEIQEDNDYFLSIEDANKMIKAYPKSKRDTFLLNVIKNLRDTLEWEDNKNVLDFYTIADNLRSEGQTSRADAMVYLIHRVLKAEGKL